MAERMDDAGRGRPDHGGRWRIAVWGGAAALLALPLAAMRITDGVDWDAADFATFGVMLLGACLAWEAAVRMTERMTRRGAYRLASGLAIVAAFGLLWLELAVGLFGPG